jgi:hypothetical protein
MTFWPPLYSGVANERLDAASRRVVVAAAIRFGCFLCFALLPWLFGLRCPREALGALRFLCLLGAAIAAFFAVLRGDRWGAASLNRWHEALSLLAIGLLLIVIENHI